MKNLELRMEELEVVEEMDAAEDAITRTLGVIGMAGLVLFGATMT